MAIASQGKEVVQICKPGIDPTVPAFVVIRQYQ